MRPPKNVLSNWSILVDDFNTSGQDFFSQVETNIVEREIPQPEFSRVTLPESGILSDKREYLRITKGNLLFDIGAAPYGKGFFFSWWLVRKSPTLTWIYPLALLGMLLSPLLTEFMRDDEVVIIFCAFAAIFVVRLLGAGNIEGMKTSLYHAPIIGWITRLFINPYTYHAQDLAAMYQESIRRSINDAIDSTLENEGKPALTPEQKQFRSVLVLRQVSFFGRQGLYWDHFTCPCLQLCQPNGTTSI